MASLSTTKSPFIPFADVSSSGELALADPRVGPLEARGKDIACNREIVIRDAPYITVPN